MEKIGKYEVLEKIGTGGFGVVYKGRDPFIKRPVAIKTCNSDDEDMRRRFCREAEIAGNLHHKNVTTVYDFGYQGEVPYLVQEYLPGEDLDKLIEQRALSPAEKLDYLVQIAAGLEYAHSQGVIHRDIKPSNVRVVDRVRVKIMDFGIAKLANQDSQLTKTGMTLGTASYLSPEQIRGEELTAGVDIFAFGVLAYELFAHRRPFIGASLSNLFYQILSAEAPPLRTYAPDCPPALATVIERCLHKEPGGRWANCGELLHALERVRDEEPEISADAGPTAYLKVGADTPDEQNQTVVLSQSRARQELAAVQARIEELLAAGDPTAAEIEISLARKRFLDVPGAAAALEPLHRRAMEARDRQEEGRRRGEKLVALLTRGRTLATAGEHQEAALVLRTALELDPQSPEASRLLAEVQERAAAAARRQALADGAAAVAAQLDRGEVTAAAAGLERLARDHGDASELASLRAVVEERRRRTRAAELRREGERQAAAGDLSQAVAVLREGLGLVPDDADLAAVLAAVERQKAERRAAAERAATVEAARQGIEVALTRGELDAAGTALAAAQRSLGEGFPDLRERLDAALADARARAADEAVGHGEAALGRGDLSAAIAAARRAQELVLEHAGAAELLVAVAAEEERQRVEAEELRARQAEEDRRRTEEERRRSEEERRLAEQERQRREEEERQRAEEARQRAEEERRRQVAELLATAAAALEGGDLAAAGAAARRAQGLAPGEAAAGELLTRIAAAESRRRAEEEELRRRQAEEERLRQVEAAAAAGEAALDRGDLVAAEAAARRLQGLAADDPRGAALLARVAEETQRRRAEEEALRRQRAEEERQRQIAALVAEVAALAAAGKLRRARKSLDRGAATLGEDPALAGAEERLAVAEAAAAAAGTREGSPPWRWIGAAAAGVAVVVVAAVVWSGGDGGDASTPAGAAPTVASAEGVPVGLPAAVAPAAAEGPPAAALEPEAVPTLPDAAGVPSPAPPAGPEPATDAVAQHTRELVQRGRAALSRGDGKTALAAAREAWGGDSGDPEVAQLVADLTRAATAAATAAERDARAAGAPELAADSFRRAEARRQEGARRGVKEGAAGAEALWASVPLYAEAEEIARTEKRRLDGERQAQAAQAERERLAAERARQAQPPPAPRPAEPRATERPAPPRDETAQVREVVERYRQAYQALDADAVKAVWPGVDAGRLRGAYGQLKGVALTVVGCQASGAAATCEVEQRIVPKAGSPLTNRLQVRLRKGGGGWYIDGVGAL